MIKYQWVVKERTPFGESLYIPVNEAYPDYGINFDEYDSPKEAADALLSFDFIQEAQDNNFVLVRKTYEEVTVVFIDIPQTDPNL